MNLLDADVYRFRMVPKDVELQLCELKVLLLDNSTGEGCVLGKGVRGWLSRISTHLPRSEGRDKVRCFPRFKEGDCIPSALPVSEEAALCEFPVYFNTFDSPQEWLTDALFMLENRKGLWFSCSFDPCRSVANFLYKLENTPASARVDIAVIMTAVTTALDLSLFLPNCSRGGELEICVCEIMDEHWSEGKTVVNDGDRLEPSTTLWSIILCWFPNWALPSHELSLDTELMISLASNEAEISRREESCSNRRNPTLSLWTSIPYDALIKCPFTTNKSKYCENE